MADNVTGGDLFKLWQTANVCLPRVAKVFTDVNGGVAGSANGDFGAFSHGESRSGGPGGSKVYSAWAPVRNEFQLIVAQTAQNLLDAQTALNTAIEAYKEQDQAAAQDLQKNYMENPAKHDPNDPSQNPPEGEYKPGQPKPPEYYESPADRK